MTAPREPTKEMLAQGRVNFFGNRYEDNRLMHETSLRSLWRAMWDAAPAAPPEPIRDALAELVASQDAFVAGRYHDYEPILARCDAAWSAARAALAAPPAAPPALDHEHPPGMIICRVCDDRQSNAPPEPAADALTREYWVSELSKTPPEIRNSRAVDLLVQQARELADMTIRAECAEMVCRDKDADWVTENARAKSAEADRDALADKLRAIIDAYDRYRGRGVNPAPAEYADVVAAIDAARAKAAR